MGVDRFDALSRSLSSGHTRRTLTRLLGSLSLGGVLSALGTLDVAAGTRLGGAPCNKNTQCQTGRCVGPTGTKTCSCSTTKPRVGCTPPDDPCKKAVCKVDTQRCVNRNKCTMQAPGSCGRTGVCDDGTCLKYGTTTECGARSCSNNQVVAPMCDGDGNCVAGGVILTCGLDEECEDAGCKRPNGGDCGDPDDCISGFCVGERCCQSACTPPNGSGICLGGTCTCSGNFESCNDDGACECDVGAGCESGGEAGTRQCVGSGCVCVT